MQLLTTTFPSRTQLMSLSLVLAAWIGLATTFGLVANRAVRNAER